MVLSYKISNQSINADLQRPQTAESLTKQNNMLWSQVMVRKQMLLMYSSLEYNIYHCQQSKIIYSKVWRTGGIPDSILIDMAGRFELFV